MSLQQVSLPVFIAKEIENNKRVIEGDLLGTAFAIGKNFFISAGHVVHHFFEKEKHDLIVGIYDVISGVFTAAEVHEVEVLKKDIGILKIDPNIAEQSVSPMRLKWVEEPLYILDKVCTAGYPHGLHRLDDSKAIIIRGFSGNIISHHNRFRPISSDEECTEVYEVSFKVPCELSGAPLLNTSGELHVHGILIGNWETRLSIRSFVEKEEEKTIEQYDIQNFGIAVTVPEILRLHSSIIGGTIGDHLNENNLLIRSPSSIYWFPKNES